MIWEDYLNSQWYDWRGSGASEERLERPAWRSQFLTEHALVDPGPPSPEELQAMRTLRGSLRELTSRISDSVRVEEAPPLSDTDFACLNSALVSSPYTKRLSFGNGALSLVEIPSESGWQGIMAKIAASYADSLAHGELERFRICDNPDCRWIYYDTTRNRSKRYCDDKCCGNLMKVRRFRERAKTASTTSRRKKDEK
ncbi:CGNR zinc finger domain-containing protein [Paenibacillus sp. P22]|uniref:CGNR zinc finger domain-containing protein n=1 Tax=Paenibacillus sp. P22 TaxID=483908 RepID=UPI00041262AD|nr:CGNR zinc finger domain-containing protein [Paenibacillus sp. P22]